jgi:dihydroxyacetone kinase-like protein
MEAAANHVHSGKGILFIVKNYSGDIMNFEMGADILDLEHQTIVVNDDVAVEDSTYTTGRRGVAGTMIVEKTVGSLAETGASLDECKNFGNHVNKMTASMGIAFTSCTVPAAGKPTFDIGSDEMEFGVGIHGEPGRKREKIKTADEITSELMGAILEDLKPENNQEVLLHANGFGGTPLMELYLLFNSAKKILDHNNIKITRSLIGNFTTSLDMAGGSLTVVKLDDKIIQHWDSPVHTPALRWKI